MLPVLAEVLPGGVSGLDQRQLLLATPAFELLFAAYGLIDILKGFEPDKTRAAIVPGETGDGATLVLVHSPPQIIGDAAVENVRAACHEVDVKVAFMHQRDGSTRWLRWHVTKEAAGPFGCAQGWLFDCV